MPPAELRRYFTTFYHVSYASDGEDRVEDLLHPEWGNLRFACGDTITAAQPDGELRSGLSFCATGPSSRTIRFSLGPRGRMWGIGLLPLGWAQFVRIDAASLANCVRDGSDPAFAPFQSLAGELYGRKADLEGEYARICAHFSRLLEKAAPDGPRIVAVHAALIDPEVHSVSELVELAGCSQRTVERVCQRAFGFSPKLLLRRQRFLRSLAEYMLDPSLKWIGALDRQYHDQAQFVRDFKEFMGITPRQYAALRKPILGAVMRERALAAGSAVQALDSPAGGGA